MIEKVRFKHGYIAHGDCLDVMKKIPDNSVDMVLCDLPYGCTRNEWGAIIPFYLLWDQYFRICKFDANIVLFSNGIFTGKLMLSCEKYFKYKITYVKPNPVGFLNAKKQPLRKCEDICVFYRKLGTYNPQMWYSTPYIAKRKSHGPSNYGYRNECITVNRSGERFPIDVIYGKKIERKYHPTQKPEDILRYLIKTYSNENDIILDNCCGSGSTCVAALKENRRFIGIEKNDEYYKISVERLNKEYQWEEA